MSVFQGSHQELQNYQEHRASYVERLGYGAPVYLVSRHYRHFVNIGVCGLVGSGKSSLVNALLNLSPSDPDGAQVGIGAKTQSPVAYTLKDELFWGSPEVSPERSNAPWWKPILLWDLPGAGTRRWPKEAYVKDLGICFYDLVLVVSSRRVSEVDRMLAMELQKARVPFFFVRTKMDIDVKNNELDNAAKEQETLDIVRQSLIDNGMPITFMLSTRRPATNGLHLLRRNLYAWLRLHARYEEPLSESQCPVCTEHMQGLVESSEPLKTSEVHWTVEVDRSEGAPLGIDLDSETLEIISVLDKGLIPNWNAKQSEQRHAVQAGDRIHMVNGFTLADAVIAECKDCHSDAARVLEISMVRVTLDRKDESASLGPDRDALRGLGLNELLHRTCESCGLNLCGRCVEILASATGREEDSTRCRYYVLCPRCNRLMEDSPSDRSWLTWLSWYWS